MNTYYGLLKKFHFSNTYAVLYLLQLIAHAALVPTALFITSHY